MRIDRDYLYFRSNANFFLSSTPKMSASNTETNGEVCSTCKKEYDNDDSRNISKLFQKGGDTINESSRKRCQEDVDARIGQRVHKLCRITWTNTKDIKRALNQS